MKRFAVFLSLFALIFGSVCCSTHHLHKQDPIHLTEVMRKCVWIDASFSPKETADIIRAFKTVECSTNYSLVQLEFTTNVGFFDYMYILLEDSIVVENTTSKDPRFVGPDKQFKKEGNGKHTVGLCLSGEYLSTVLIPRDRIFNPTTFYRVALHEAIHAALKIHIHSGSTKAIMYPAIDESSVENISEDDFKLICEIYGCDPGKMKACVGEK